MRVSIAVSITAFFIVALMSQFNLLLLFISWGIVASVFGQSFADNYHVALYAFAAAIQTGLFAVFFFPIYLFARRRSDAVAIAVVVVLTIVYLAIWFGLTIASMIEMTRTNTWP
jgi:hypothetical protein